MTTQSGTGAGDGTNGKAGPADPFGHPAPPGAAKKMSEVLGEITWLMSQSPLHKQFYISDLEWFVMTPVLLQQFRLFYAQDRPIGVLLWAEVDGEVASRLAAGTTRLRPQDWKSGAAVPPAGGPVAGGQPKAQQRDSQLWVVEAIAPFGGAEEMVKDLKAKVFPDREIRFVRVTAEGRKEVRVV